MKTITFKTVVALLALLACLSLANAQARKATVISDHANLRDSPSQSSEIKQEIASGTMIEVLDQKGPWYVVRIDDSVGWMHGNTLRFDSSLQPSRRVRSVTSQSSGANTASSINAASNAVQSNDPGSPRPSSDRTYFEGPRGGCYYLSNSGSKIYVDRNLCGSSTISTSSDSAEANSPNSVSTSSQTNIRGPRGGCYHYSKSGKKVYVDRSRCN